jgi:hypothetical protein
VLARVDDGYAQVDPGLPGRLLPGRQGVEERRHLHEVWARPGDQRYRYLFHQLVLSYYKTITEASGVDIFLFYILFSQRPIPRVFFQIFRLQYDFIGVWILVHSGLEHESRVSIDMMIHKLGESELHTLPSASMLNSPISVNKLDFRRCRS